MSYRGHTDGLYLVQQWRPDKGVTHVAVLDLGNSSGYAATAPSEPLLIHLSPSGLQVERLHGTGQWSLMERAPDTHAAVNRLLAAASNSRYNVLANNCEHFARFVVRGLPESPQLVGALVFTGLVAALVVSGRRAA